MTTAYRQLRPVSIRTSELPALAHDEPATVSIRVVYECPHCTRQLRIRPEYFGRPLACKRCDRRFVPSLAQALSGPPGRAGESRRPAPAPTSRRLASG